MANQSKLQLSLLVMEQHNLLLITTAYKIMQLKKPTKQRKHCWWVYDINRNRLHQGVYHNLVKEPQFDGEKFQQFSSLASYSGFPIEFCTKLQHESLHGAFLFISYSAIRSCTTNRMPHPDIWKPSHPFTRFSISAASASRIY